MQHLWLYSMLKEKLKTCYWQWRIKRRDKGWNTSWGEWKVFSRWVLVDFSRYPEAVWPACSLSGRYITECVKYFTHSCSIHSLTYIIVLVQFQQSSTTNNSRSDMEQANITDGVNLRGWCVKNGILCDKKFGDFLKTTIFSWFTTYFNYQCNESTTLTDWVDNNYCFIIFLTYKNPRIYLWQCHWHVASKHHTSAVCTS